MSAVADGKAMRSGQPARTGWVSTPDKTPDEYRQGLGGMGVSFPPDLVTTCRKLVYSIIDTCTRTRTEVGCLHRP